MTDVNAAPDHSDEIVIEEERRRVNGTGLTALIIVILGFIAPIVIVIAANVMARESGQTPGTIIVSTAIAVFIAAIVSVGLVVLGVVIGIVALFRRNRGKGLASISIALGLVPVVFFAIVATVFSDAIPTLFS